MKYINVFILTTTVVIISEMTVAKPESQTLKKQIKSKILKDYDATVVPTNATVRVRFYIHKFDVHQNDKITMWLYTGLYWADDRLRWNPKDFDDIISIDIIGDVIWKPELISISENGAPKEEFRVHKSQQHVYYAVATNYGDISFVYSSMYQTRCELNMSDWPNDINSCYMRFGTYPSSEFKIDPVVRAYGSSDYDHIEWEFDLGKPQLLKGDSNSTTYKYIIETKLDFIRKSSLYVGMYTFPVSAIMVATLLLFWFNPLNSLRLVMFTIFVFIECIILQTVANLVTHTGASPPLIVKKFNSVLVITVICVLETVFNRVLLTLNSCPLWLYQFNLLISKIKILQNFNMLKRNDSRLVELNEESAQQAAICLNEGEPRKTKLLENTVSVIDNSMFLILVVLFTYIALTM